MENLIVLVAGAKELNAEHCALPDLHAPWRWIAPGRAAEFSVPAQPPLAQIVQWRAHLAPAGIDIFVTPAHGRVKKLLLSDMDSTIIAEETLDEVAVAVGLGAPVAALTARAMRGEIDFETTLRQRVAMLRGTPAETLRAVCDRATLNPGARELVAGMKAQGACTVLVTGGFTLFSAAVAARCGFDRHHANELEMKDGAMTGAVVPPILDKSAKKRILLDYCARHALDPAASLALGDGANDLPMLQAAGLGIGYRPKALLRENLANCIIHGDLTAALYVQGLVPPAIL